MQRGPSAWIYAALVAVVFVGLTVLLWLVGPTWIGIGK